MTRVLDLTATNLATSLSLSHGDVQLHLLTLQYQQPGWFEEEHKLGSPSVERGHQNHFSDELLWNPAYSKTPISCFLLLPHFLLFHFWLHELIVFVCSRVLHSLSFSSSGPEILIPMNFSLALTYCSDSSFLSFPRDNVLTIHCPLLDPVAKPTE